MAEKVSVRMAVWGIGYHAEKNVLPAIAACDGVSLAGLYSRDQQRARRGVIAKMAAAQIMLGRRRDAELTIESYVASALESICCVKRR